MTVMNWVDFALADPKYDPNLDQAVAALVEQGRLDKGAPAYGVALAAMAHGYDRLTRAQKGLFDRVLTPALAASQKTEPPSSGEAPSQAAGSNSWKPIREAPGDRDVQLGIRDRSGVSPVAFACRRIGRVWVQAENSKPLFIRPTHWREWLNARD